MPKGLKSCTDCGRETGVRTKVCECGKKFWFKPPVLRGKEINWQELEVGEIIKIIQGTGTYWYNSENGEKIYMNDKAKMKVVKKSSQGLQVISKYGFSYLDMVSEGYCESTGLHRYPPRLRTFKKKGNKGAR
jgi:hypothetical protein